jgi:hypothetical protein
MTTDNPILSWQRAADWWRAHPEIKHGTFYKWLRVDRFGNMQRIENGHYYVWRDMPVPSPLERGATVKEETK